MLAQDSCCSSVQCAGLFLCNIVYGFIEQCFHASMSWGSSCSCSDIFPFVRRQGGQVFCLRMGAMRNRCTERSDGSDVRNARSSRCALRCECNTRQTGLYGNNAGFLASFQLFLSVVQVQWRVLYREHSPLLGCRPFWGSVGCFLGCEVLQEIGKCSFQENSIFSHAFKRYNSSVKMI